MKTKTQAKKDKRNYIIVALVVILLLLAVGYASFSETLKITGTATGTVTWDVHFTEESEGTVSEDGKGLTVTTNLAYPGDATTVTAKIENSSSVAAKLTNFKVTGLSDTTDITLKYVDLSDETEVLQPNGVCTYTFVVGWDKDSEKTSVNDTYTITFDYVQDTTTPSLTPSHSNS